MNDLEEFKKELKSIRKNKELQFKLALKIFDDMPYEAKDYSDVSCSLAIIDEEISDIDYMRRRKFSELSLQYVLNSTTCGVVYDTVKKFLKKMEDNNET